MKKVLLKTVLSAVLIFGFSSVFALSVNESELESAENKDSITFENYSGPHRVIESIDSIRGIGSSLGNMLENPGESAFLSTSPKYSVIHAVDSSEAQKLDADIFIINSSATVDHIDNLRRIISAYLISAYGYSQKDADTLAVFITVYNAVYRSDMDFWASRYKQVVTKELSEEKAGLALSYTEWPGKTQIVIPLSEVTDGGLSTVDTSAISDKNVVSSMQDDADKGVDVRKDMLDIKEREADLATDKAAQAKKAEIEGQKELQKEEERLPALRNSAEEAAKDAAKNPDDEQKQLIAEQKKQDVKKSEEKIQNLKDEINSSAQTAKTQQAKADRKTNEAISERSEIAKDQQKIVNGQSEESAPVFALKLSNEAKQLSTLVKVNSKNGKTLKESPVTMLHSRTFYQVGSNFLAIAGENKGNAAVKLVLLDPEKMEVIEQSKVNVAENSVLIRAENNYLCVISEGKDFYIGKFNEKLELLNKSEITVNKATPVTVLDKTVYVTNAKGKLVQLSLNDLKAL